eukprot:scaffold33_cov123-Amphora_coffeaeformis.AAC.3
MLVDLPRETNAWQGQFLSRSSLQDEDEDSSGNWRLFDDAELDMDPLLGSFDPSSKSGDDSTLLIDDEESCLGNWRLFDDAELEKDPLFVGSFETPSATCDTSAVSIDVPVVERVDARRSKQSSPVFYDTEQIKSLLHECSTQSWSLVSKNELEAESDLVEKEADLSRATDVYAQVAYAELIDLSFIEHIMLSPRCQFNASRRLCALEVDKILRSGNEVAA